MIVIETSTWYQDYADYSAMFFMPEGVLVDSQTNASLKSLPRLCERSEAIVRKIDPYGVTPAKAGVHAFKK